MRQRESKQRKPNPSAQKDAQPVPPKKELVQGVATEMWLELVPFSESEDPNAHVRSLWLLVNGVWLRYDLEPSPESRSGSNTDGTPETETCCKYDHIERAVLSAFSDCADRLQVRVWYQIDYPVNGKALGSTDPRGAEKSPYNIPIVGLVVHSK